MRKLLIILGGFLILELIVLNVFFNKNYDNLDYINFKRQIDSLSLKVEVLQKEKDSILNTIGSRWNSIDSIEKSYEETNNLIYNMSPDSQYMFFSDYLKRSRNNSRATSAN